MYFLCFIAALIISTIYSDETTALLRELDALTGLEPLKRQVRSFIEVLEYNKLVVARGGKPTPLTNHLIFAGQPGTGKTTVAGLIARILKSLKVISKGTVVEGTRASMIGQYVGHTAIATGKIIKKALGGVLFIDEIGSLCRDTEDPFGMEAVGVILAAVENMRADLIVIIAGYPSSVAHFLSLDAGLPSRFPTTLPFDNFTLDQLMHIFGQLAPHVARSALGKVKAMLHAAMKQPTFSNARTVRNIVDNASRARAARVMATRPSDIYIFVKADFA